MIVEEDERSWEVRWMLMAAPRLLQPTMEREGSLE